MNKKATFCNFLLPEIDGKLGSSLEIIRKNGKEKFYDPFMTKLLHLIISQEMLELVQNF